MPGPLMRYRRVKGRGSLSWRSPWDGDHAAIYSEFTWLAGVQARAGTQPQRLHQRVYHRRQHRGPFMAVGNQDLGADSGHLCRLKNVSRCPGWCGSVDQALACELKGRWFNPWSGHMPGLQARSPVGGAQEVTTHCCFCPFLSPFPSL